MPTTNKLNMIITLLISIIYFSCSKQEFVEEPEEEMEMISSVCTHDSIRVDTMIWDLYGDIIKLPSVFTPNDDGEADFFFPRFENDSITISQYSIYTPEDDWSDVRILYSTSSLLYSEGQVDRAWDGISSNIIDPYLEEHEGAFRFSFFAFKDEGTITCRGWGCVDRSE